MGMRRAHEHAVGLVRLRRILDETAASTDEGVILDARLEMMIVLASCLIHARPPYGQLVIARGRATSMGEGEARVSQIEKLFGNDCRSLDLKPRGLLDQSGHLHDRHGGKMRANDLAVGAPKFPL